MLEQLASDIQNIISAIQQNLLFAIKIILAIWIIHLFNFFFSYQFNNLGIRTRSFKGLPGIFLAPILHGNFSHLFFNTIPLLVLASLLLINGKILFYQVSLAIIIISGLLTWLLGRRGIHIGASGLIMGYLGYLLAKAYFNLNGTTVILAIIALYYFGGLLFSIFPSTKRNVSWDGHIFGLISGIFVAYLPY